MQWTNSPYQLVGPNPPPQPTNFCCVESTQTRVLEVQSPLFCQGTVLDLETDTCLTAGQTRVCGELFILKTFFPLWCEEQWHSTLYLISLCWWLCITSQTEHQIRISLTWMIQAFLKPFPFLSVTVKPTHCVLFSKDCSVAYTCVVSFPTVVIVSRLSNDIGLLLCGRRTGKFEISRGCLDLLNFWISAPPPPCKKVRNGESSHKMTMYGESGWYLYLKVKLLIWNTWQQARSKRQETALQKCGRWSTTRRCDHSTTEDKICSLITKIPGFTWLGLEPLCEGPNRFSVHSTTAQGRGHCGNVGQFSDVQHFQSLPWKQEQGALVKIDIIEESPHWVESHTHTHTHVVISQTHSLVSRVRLPRWCESLALLSTQWRHLTSGGSIFTAGVSHHTPPPPGGTGLYRQF